MGCAQGKANNSVKISHAELKRSSTNGSIKTKKQQQQQDFESLNSQKPKIMPIISSEKDYNPRYENYLKHKEPVKLPIQSNGKRSINEILLNQTFSIQGSKQSIPDISKYKVPKITYPKLDLSSIEKRRQKTEVLKE